MRGVKMKKKYFNDYENTDTDTGWNETCYQNKVSHDMVYDLRERGQKGRLYVVLLNYLVFGLRDFYDYKMCVKV